MVNYVLLWQDKMKKCKAKYNFLLKKHSFAGDSQSIEPIINIERGVVRSPNNSKVSLINTGSFILNINNINPIKIDTITGFTKDLIEKS